MPYRLALSVLRVYVRGRLSEKTKKFVKGICKLIKTKRTTRAADADIRSVIGDKLDSYTPVGVWENSVEVWVQPVDEEWI